MGRNRLFRRITTAAVAVLFGLTSGCGLDEVQIPDLTGPSELADSLRITANPDVLYSGEPDQYPDKPTTSVIQATLLDQNAQPSPGRQIFFTVADESGRFADIGTLGVSPTGNFYPTGAFAATNNQGVATIYYRSPPRTDSTANQSVMVMARPVGTDFNGAIYRSVRIELRSPEPRLFPANPNNTLPLCNFIVEAPNGLRTFTSILFQSTASDPDGTIVRYEWFLGDGNNDTEYKPDFVYVYRAAGSYTVTQIVTDDDGGQAACATRLVITN